MSPGKELLSDIFDVLANNTNFAAPGKIAKNYDIEVNFDNSSITIFDTEREKVIAVLKYEYINRENHE